jgi:geranylgeranyl diphosphate/geranylgeranyl-bacteriochlorophyllide a reductase
MHIEKPATWEKNFIRGQRSHYMTATVAIIGGGPAGSVCALDLAAGGIHTVLFERNIHREKPCGGGLTWRAFQALPELAEYKVPAKEIRQFRVIGPEGRSLDLALSHPIHIVSRQDFDQRLRSAAIRNGAELIREAAREIRRDPGGGWRVNGRRFDIIVGAGGVNDPLARKLKINLNRGQRTLAVGSFVPGRFAPRIICRFFSGIQGYAWWFPRKDHASLGIEIAGEMFAPKLARELLEKFVRENLDCTLTAESRPYCWTAPLPNDELLQSNRFCGQDWLLVGDAAGLVDCATGEGLCHALASGRLAAGSILSGTPTTYWTKLKERILPELDLSSRLAKKLYNRRFLNMVFRFLPLSPTACETAAETAIGKQPYQGLKRRILGEAPKILVDYTLSGAKRFLTGL